MQMYVLVVAITKNVIGCVVDQLFRFRGKVGALGYLSEVGIHF